MRYLPRLLALLGALAASGAFAQEWTRFRGPNGTGLSDTTFPASWQEKDFAWRIDLPGTGHSSPVVWGNRVFVTCCDPQSAQRIVVCVSAKDGSTLWKTAYDSRTFRQHADNSYASATPTVDADRVYVCWNTPEQFTVVALSHEGKELWKTDLGAFVSQHGGGNSPIVVGDKLLIGDDQEGEASALFGLDCATGKVAWKTPRATKKFSAATPIIFRAGNQEQAVFTSQAEGMAGIDPASGKVLWQIKGIFDSRTVGSPTTGDGLIFATCGEGAGGHVLMAIQPAENGHAKIAWQTHTDTPYVPTPIVKGNLLFYWADRGIVTAVRATTGEQVWQEHVPGSYYSSPICAGSTLFNINKKGEVIALSAGEKFQLLGQTNLTDKCHATPAISGGQMFIRTFGHLYCLKGTGGQADAR